MNFELKNLSLSFDKKTLFQNLNLRFTGPKIYGLLGPSGCGKSTLLRLLAKLQEPDSGEILSPEGLNQGFIFQESHLLNWRNAFENVHLPFELKNKTDENAALKALEAVGLKEAEDLYPSELSGGMKMRVSLARAFVTEPKVMYCDEPFAALDELTRENLQQYLRAKIIQNDGICFFVTHNLTEALVMADEIFYFKSPGVIAPEPFLVNRYQTPAEQIDRLRKLL